MAEYAQPPYYSGPSVKIHAPDQKETFPCDYRKCSRGNSPFTRKDHYRDHLRDFHKEDIGSPKGGKKIRNDKEKFTKIREGWLAERQISSTYWRCTRCLVRHYVTRDGWECRNCMTACEEDRVKVRERMLPKEVNEASIDRMDVESQNQSSLDYTSASCTTCGGAGYRDDGFGNWEVCSICRCDWDYF